MSFGDKISDLIGTKMQRSGLLRSTISQISLNSTVFPKDKRETKGKREKTDKRQTTSAISYELLKVQNHNLIRIDSSEKLDLLC